MEVCRQQMDRLRWAVFRVGERCADVTVYRSGRVGLVWGRCPDPPQACYVTGSPAGSATVGEGDDAFDAILADPDAFFATEVL